MSIQADIRTYLLTQTGVTDLIGSRIYAMKLPKKAVFPSLTYSTISSVRTRSHSGDSSLTTPRIQLSCWGEKYQDCKDLAAELVSSLESYKGLMGSTTVYSSFVENELDLYDSESKVYHVPVDVKIRYNG